MSGSLGEREMLWEHKPQASVSTAFFEFSQTFMSVSIYNLIETQRKCFLFLLENSLRKN